MVNNSNGTNSESGFQNRKEYGFREDGCIFGYKDMHEAYFDGELTDRECLVVDGHLLECRLCENTWDALTNEMEETFPRKVRDADGE